MKALAHRIKFIFSYVGAILRFNWQIETAFPRSVLGELLTTLCWNIMFILFARVVTLKVNYIAGYSYEDWVVFLTVMQLTFYITTSLSGTGVERFVDIVKDGRFDAFLVKPVSILLQIFTCRIKTFHTVMSAFIPMVMYFSLIISQGGFKTSGIAIFYAIIAWIIGFFIQHFFYFAIAMSVLWTQKTRNLLKIVYLSGNIGNYPIEAYTEPIRTIVIFLATTPITVGVTVSYLLEKTTDLSLLLLQAFFATLFFALFVFLWKKGLPKYESFSS